MKKTIYFSFYEEPCSTGKSNELTSEIYKDFAMRWPQFRPPGAGGINVDLPLDSPLLKEILSYLKDKAGKSPHWERSPSVFDDPEHFQIRGRKAFTRAEILESEWCYCMPDKELISVPSRQGNGDFVARPKSIKSQPIGYGWPGLSGGGAIFIL